MTIDWRNHENRKFFRKALESVYPDPGDFKIFVQDAIDKNLDGIVSGKNLNQTIFELVEWANSQDCLDKIYREFCKENNGNFTVDKLNASLANFLVKKSSPTISEQQWNEIFTYFNGSDISELASAVKLAFYKFFGKSFSVIRPDVKIESIEAIYKLLSQYDDLELTQIFIQSAIENIQRIDSSRNFYSLEQIYRLNRDYQNSSSSNIELPSSAYLLVSFEEIAGRVRVSSSLYFKGKNQQSFQHSLECELGEISMDESPDKVSELISEQIGKELSVWINQAQLLVKNLVVVELFLPYKLLSTRIDEWNMIRLRFNRKCKLCEHTPFIVRSLDRCQDTVLRFKLKTGWNKLMNVIENNITDHIKSIDYSSNGSFSASLFDKHCSIFLPRGLPADHSVLEDLLIALVDSPVPIAFWTHDREADVDKVINTFMELLTQNNLQEFASLAIEIKKQRDPTSAICTMGMLCDFPDRFPTDPADFPLLTPSENFVNSL